MSKVVWFSCGAASAVAAKVACETGDVRDVVYCDTLSTEHPDNVRFFEDVQTWIGRPIRKIKSTKFDSIDDVFVRTKYMSGIKGARCTTEMKKIPRVYFQLPTDVHVFGYTSDEKKRADDFEERNPELSVEWILIDQGISKTQCLDRLSAAGIALPAMYTLGFDHNNCIGCVKATSPGYWNRTRKYFPEVFKRRAEQSRALGARLTRVKNVRIFLDELDPSVQAPDDAIECGPVCQEVKE